MHFAQAFKLLNGYAMERRLLRAAYLQRFPTDDAMVQMAVGQKPEPCAGAANGAAATSSHAPAAIMDIPQCSLPVSAEVCCSCIAVLCWWCPPLL